MSTSAGVIPKRDAEHIPHYLTDYAAARRSFSWASARRELAPGPEGALNMAHVAIDRQVESGRGSQLAMRFVDQTSKRVVFTYDDLRSRCNAFATVLDSLGLCRGACIATLLGRIPEAFISILGALKGGYVCCPLLTACGPEPLRTWLELGHAAVLVTTEPLYRREVAGLRSTLPELRHVLIVRDGDSDAERPTDTLDLAPLMRLAGSHHAVAPTRVHDVALLHFTSGTTGTPKGVKLTHGAVIAQHTTCKLALDLHPAENFWCTADPSSVTGIAYGLIGPLTCGATVIVDREEFDPQRCYRILAEERVSVWYTAPLEIRMLIEAGTVLTRAHTYPRLRFMASVGEPLSAEAVRWGTRAFGMPFHDTWWQTETGAIMIANFAACDVLPGSMGRAVPGIDAQIVRRRPDGTLAVIDSPDEVGEIALRSGWPSMFSDYLDGKERYRECFVDGWYLSGDLARRDRGGFFWFVGRAEDVIQSAGHLISPFEVESTLMTHPAVAQVAVIGVPDPIAGQAAKAFVELRDGFAPGDALSRDILAHARRRLGAVVAPREIAFAAALPHTRNGKIMRQRLRV